MKTNKIWLVEWSEKCQQFHIQTLGEAVAKNRNAYYNRKGLDWQPIAIIPNFEDADDEDLERFFERLEHQRREHLPVVIRE